MSRPKVHSIDWRRLFEQLQPYLAHKGGVVHIQTKKESPISTFTKVLRSKMEYDAWDRRWVTVVIDGANPATHYLSDMMYQIEITMGIQTSADQIQPSQISVGSYIRAGGGVQVGDIHINLGEKRSEVRRILHPRMDQIIQRLDESSEQQRLGIIFYESHNADRKQLAAFRTVVWDSALEKLIEKGLLLMDISNEGSVQDSWPPEPDLVVDLPDKFDKESSKDAVDDLATISLQEGIYSTEEEARAFATGIVAQYESPRDLYAKLSVVLTKASELRDDNT